MRLVEEVSVEEYYERVANALRRCHRDDDRNYDRMVMEVVDAKRFFDEEGFSSGILYCRATLIALEFANTLSYGVRDVARLKERAKRLVCDVYAHYRCNRDEMEPSQKRQILHVFEIIFEVFFRILAFSGDRKEMRYWQKWARDKDIVKPDGARFLRVYSLPVVGFWLGEQIFEKKF